MLLTQRVSLAAPQQETIRASHKSLDFKFRVFGWAVPQLLDEGCVGGLVAHPPSFHGLIPCCWSAAARRVRVSLQ